MAMEIFSHFNNNEAQLPPGFRFHPTDEELITYYLMKKVIDSGFTGRAIAEVDLNKCEPWELPLKAKMGEKEWYFFTLLDRKYPTGLRTNRATESGYWKATGKDREIYSTRTGSLVGMKKTLVFYKGRAPKGEKSNWVMHEYRLEGKLSYHCLSGSSKDEWVVCRVFQKSTGGGSIGKKGRVVVEGSTHIDVGSPSSTSLPHLLDFPAFGGGGGCSGGMTDRESCCSYEAESAREHVPCFSTMLGFGQPPPPAPQHPLTTVTSPAPSGLSLGFPCLGPLQQSLNMPFFFPTPSADHGPIGGSNTACGPAGEWEAEDQKLNRGRMMMGHTELDCMWTF